MSSTNKTSPTTTFFLLDTLKYAHVLVTGQQYTVRVKANFTPMIGSPLDIANQGYSQIGAFTYQPGSIFPGNGLAANGITDSSATATGLPIPLSSIKPGGYIVQNYSPTSACPAATPITNTTNITTGISGQDLTIGSFKLHIDNATANKDGSYTGTGYITWHPFASDLHLAVSFDTLKVNTDKVVYGGIARTTMTGGFQQASPFASATTTATASATGTGTGTGTGTASSSTPDPVAALTGLDNNTYQSINTRINSTTNQINQAPGSAELGFPLGLNTTLGGAPFTLAIMGISFQPACTNMNVLLNLNLPDLGGWLPLAGTGFQVEPNKLLSRHEQQQCAVSPGNIPALTNSGIGTPASAPPAPAASSTCSQDARPLDLRHECTSTSTAAPTPAAAPSTRPKAPTSNGTLQPVSAGSSSTPTSSSPTTTASSPWTTPTKD